MSCECFRKSTKTLLEGVKFVNYVYPSVLLKENDSNFPKLHAWSDAQFVFHQSLL